MVSPPVSQVKFAGVVVGFSNSKSTPLTVWAEPPLIACEYSLSGLMSELGNIGDRATQRETRAVVAGCWSDHGVRCQL